MDGNGSQGSRYDHPERKCKVRREGPKMET